MESLEDLRLRTLGNVDRIFERQGMELKDLAELVEQRLVAESLDIDPRDALRRQDGAKLADVGDRAFVDVARSRSQPRTSRVRFW